MLSEDLALGNLEARWHCMDRFDDYRQILVPGSPAIEPPGTPAEVAGLARDLSEELPDLMSQLPTYGRSSSNRPSNKVVKFSLSQPDPDGLSRSMSDLE